MCLKLNNKFYSHSIFAFISYRMSQFFIVLYVFNLLSKQLNHKLIYEWTSLKHGGFKFMNRVNISIQILLFCFVLQLSDFLNYIHIFVQPSSKSKFGIFLSP